MGRRVLWIVLGTLCLTHVGCGGKSPAEPTAQDPVDYRSELRSTLQNLADQSADPLLRLHLNSIQQVIADPLYVQLHGLWDVAQDRMPYLAYPFSNPGTSCAFEDGYLLSPWGRGNQWYCGIAETDIGEGMAFVKALVRVDERRQYLCGHSMGGYGAWHIAHRSADLWAALGSTPAPSSTTPAS
jgi:hypothetical protein